MWLISFIISQSSDCCRWNRTRMRESHHQQTPGLHPWVSPLQWPADAGKRGSMGKLCKTQVQPHQCNHWPRRRALNKAWAPLHWQGERYTATCCTSNFANRLGPAPLQHLFQTCKAVASGRCRGKYWNKLQIQWSFLRQGFWPSVYETSYIPQIYLGLR